MTQSGDIRELNLTELDQVGGGLSYSFDLDISDELEALSGALQSAGGIGGIIGSVIGAFTGLSGIFG